MDELKCEDLFHQCQHAAGSCLEKSTNLHSPARVGLNTATQLLWDPRSFQFDAKA